MPEKIIVMPRFAVDRILKEHKKMTKKVAFITIAENEEAHLDFTEAFINSCSGVLKLTFDDVCNPALGIVFTEDDAKKIVEFVDTRKEVPFWIINCAAGISRSGAVGYWLVYYLNGDIEAFNKENPYIRPNPLVLRTLEKVAPSGRVPTNRTTIFAEFKE